LSTGNPKTDRPDSMTPFFGGCKNAGHAAVTVYLYICRMQSLETALKSCQQELKDEKAKLDELKQHFKYNLKLINDRDAELQRYDALFLGNSHWKQAYSSTFTYSYVSQNLLAFPFVVNC